MAITIVAGYSFGATELVTSTKLGTLLTSATISGVCLDTMVFYEDSAVGYNDEYVYY